MNYLLRRKNEPTLLTPRLTMLGIRSTAPATAPTAYMGLRTICPIVLLTRWPTDGRGLFVARGVLHPTHSARCCPGTLT